eukprot:47581_1
MSYNKWSLSYFIEWIIAINPSKFEQYRDLLHHSLLENNFKCTDIYDLDREDLKEYGIINLSDRKTIYKSIIKLIATQKTDTAIVSAEYHLPHPITSSPSVQSDSISVLNANSYTNYTKNYTTVYLITWWIRQNGISPKICSKFVNVILCFHGILEHQNKAISNTQIYGEKSSVSTIKSLCESTQPVFVDKEGNTYKMETLADRLDLFDETVNLITNTFDVAEPLVKCADVSRDEIYFYMHKLLSKMKNNNMLDMIFIFSNNKNNEMAFAIVCSDLFEDNIDLNENEWKQLQSKGGNMIKVLQFVELLAINGIKELEKKLGYEYGNIIKRSEKGHFFHVGKGVAKQKYAGKGATPLMYKYILEFAKNAGYKYLCQEATNPISQHIAKKYGNAKTYYEMKFSDHFEHYSRTSITKEQTAMFQVIHLK